MKKSIILFIVLALVTTIGCNKTGIKGTITYGPTNTPMEDIKISVVPKNLNTEERESFIKTGKSDKNGEFKISGLDEKYSYLIYLENDKYCLKDPKSYTLEFSTIKNQTVILNQPLLIKDILPGNGCFVKRLNNKFEPLAKFGLFSQMAINYRGFIDLKTKYTVSEPIIYFADDMRIKNSKSTKVKNGDIIYFNIRSKGGLAISRWYIFPLEKYTFDQDCENIVKTFNIPDAYIPSGIYFKMDTETYGTYVGYKRTRQELEGGFSTSMYYSVGLKNGYYLVSSIDYSYTGGRLDTRILENFLIEVTDEGSDVYDGSNEYEGDENEEDVGD